MKTYTDSGSAPCVTDNLPPVANNDSASTVEDTTVTINVTANDSDPEGSLDPTSANTACTTCTQPSDGTLVNPGTGSFNYSPNQDFNGPDSFVYEVCDTLGSCSTATVEITVDPAADPPVANDDSASTSKNTAVTINVAANDTDVDGNLDLTTANTACTGCATPSNGTLINNDDGTFAYTPSLGYVGPDSFIYEICDTNAACDTATVDITVTPTNDPPVANDDSDSTPEDSATTINVVANDTDPDSNLDPTTANNSCAACTQPSNGTLANNGDGSFLYAPAQDYNGSDSFVYEVCDLLGLCDTATVSITVTAAADPPTALDDNASTVENTTVSINVAGNDSDPEGNLDPTTANTACVGCANPSNGTLANNGDGSFNYTPNPSFTGSDNFIYEICDSTTLCDTATAFITVNSAVPDILEVRVDSSADDAEEHGAGRVALNSSDLELVFDKDNQTVGMRFNGITLPQGASITNAYIQFQADEANSEATNLTIEGEDVDNALTFSAVKFSISDTAVRPRTSAAVPWAPAPWNTVGEAGADQQTTDIAPVIQEIVDRSGWTSGNSLVIIISGTGKRVAEAYNGVAAAAPLLHVEYQAVANDPPVANDDSAGTDEETAVNIDVAANDSDPNGNLDPNTTNTTCAACSETANGTLVNNGDGTFNYTPDLNYNGSDGFVYEICDARSVCDTAAVTISINPVNDKPVAGDDEATTSKNTGVTIDADANDSDVDGNIDPTTTNTSCATCSEPANGTLVNNGDGSFNYSPDTDSLALTALSTRFVIQDRYVTPLQ